MDHLPRPSSRNYQGDDVRHPGTKLLSNVHDFHPYVPFEQYPVIRGFSLQSLSQGTFRSNDAGHAAAVLQSWLFFGLMEEAFQEPLKSSDFIDCSNGPDQFISTRLLSEYLERWKRLVEKCGTDERSQWAERTSSVFHQAAGLFSALQGPAIENYPPDFGVYLIPLAVLLETLQYQRANIFPEAPLQKFDVITSNFSPLISSVSPDEQPRNLDRIPLDLSSAIITDEFVRKGWCPYTVNHILLTEDSPSVVAYATLFREYPTFITKNHQHCTAERCSVSNVDTATYFPRHITKDCKCGYLKPDMAKVMEALESGCIPLMGLNESNGEVITFAKQWEDGIPYVAISHVWADGRGSCSEQGLPRCQIFAMKKAVQNAFNKIHNKHIDIPFWIDSLCVPSSPALRRIAIGLMARTYSSASVVLVFDEGIEQIMLSDSIHEKMFVIFVSTWVQRLWPLQEMMVAAELVFQLADGLLDHRELFSADIVSVSGQEPLTTELFGWFASLLMNKTTTIVHLDMIVWHLSRRMSSRASDEILTIAGLFGLDASEYYPLDAEERMFKFLKEHAQTRVPTDLIFLPGDKLSRPGRRWAPRNFISSEQAGNRKCKYHDEMAAVLDVGLLGRYYCLILKDRLLTVDISREYRVKVESISQEFIIMIDMNSRRSDLTYIDLFILAQSGEDSEQFPGIMATRIEDEDFDDEVVLVVELGYSVNGASSEDSRDMPCIAATWEQRFLLLR